MKQYKLIPGIFPLIIVVIVMLSGCGSQAEEPPEPEPANDSNTEQIIEDKEFSYSEGLDENGYWVGVKALDFVEGFKYKEIVIPKKVHEISDNTLQGEIDYILEGYSTSKQVTDRAVEDGDKVNIDFVGYVDGEAFEGGDTKGAGTDVTIGVTEYIDGFLEQLVGHLPGETFNIEVTFPKDYDNEGLKGKDAVFTTTVNHIVEIERPELTDDFISEVFFDKYGWKNSDDLMNSVHKELQDLSIRDFLQAYMCNDVPVKSVPDSIMKYQGRAMIHYYKNLAASNGMEFEEFLVNIEVSDTDDMLEQAYEDNMKLARYCLVSQAVAEDLNLIVSTEDLEDFIKKTGDPDDYSSLKEEYGLPYLKQMVMYQQVLDHLRDQAVME